MKQLMWIKTKIGLFSDPRVLAMIGQRGGETYFLIWCLLKDFAGSLNQGGCVRLSSTAPLTSSHIAGFIGRRRSTVEAALDFLEELEFIRRGEDGSLYLTDWDDMQDFDKMQQRREACRRRVARHRLRRRDEEDSAEEKQDGPPESACAAYYAALFGPGTRTLPAPSRPWKKSGGRRP